MKDQSGASAKPEDLPLAAVKSEIPDARGKNEAERQAHEETKAALNKRISDSRLYAQDRDAAAKEYHAQLQAAQAELNDLKASMFSWEVAKEIEILANSDKQWNEIIAERDALRLRVEQLEADLNKVIECTII